MEQDVHCTVVVNGYKMAATKSMEFLKAIGKEVRVNDEKTLRHIAGTAMTGRSIGKTKDHLSDLAVRAVRAVAEKKDGRYEVDVDHIKVEKKHGGSTLDTELVEGLIIDKERVHPRMPRAVKKAKVALIDSALEIKKTEVDAKIQIKDPTQLQAFLDEEGRTLKGYVDAIQEAGANVVFCQKGIDDLVQHHLAKEGIYALRRVKKSDMEKLSRATGAKLVTNLLDLSPKDLGRADLVEERRVSDDEMTFVTGCKNPRAVSVLIRGGTEHVVDEMERALHDALRVVGVAVEDGVAVPGGGATEIELALRLRDYATTVGGREQMAIEAFASALEIIPWTLGENAGLDSIDLLIELKKRHEGKRANKNVGVDIASGKTKDMLRSNVIEPLRVKTQAIQSATEVAGMILRIDDVIASKGMKEPEMPEGGHEHGMPPGMGGMGGMPPGMM